jgi:hypothetical protein
MPEVTPRGATHWALVAAAIASHDGKPCSGCHGKGIIGVFGRMQHAVCPHCHGFGKRELKPDPPRYTVHGVNPMSIINSHGVA